METAAPDPLDAVWPREEREAARERCREQARTAALETVKDVPSHLIDDAFREGYAADIAEKWLVNFDAGVARVAAIVRSPAAVGKQGLARQLALHSQHSADVAIRLLGGAASGDDVAVLPVGRERTTRLAAARRDALLGGM